MIPFPPLTSIRFVGQNKPRIPPFGLVSFADSSPSLMMAPNTGELVRLALTLPDPATFESGAWLFLLRDVPAPGGWRAIFRTDEYASKSTRAAALLARGYVDLGAAIDPHSRLDLVWGRAK